MHINTDIDEHLKNYSLKDSLTNGYGKIIQYIVDVIFCAANGEWGHNEMIYADPVATCQGRIHHFSSLFLVCSVSHALNRGE